MPIKANPSRRLKLSISWNWMILCKQINYSFPKNGHTWKWFWPACSIWAVACRCAANQIFCMLTWRKILDQNDIIYHIILYLCISFVSFIRVWTENSNVGHFFFNKNPNQSHCHSLQRQPEFTIQNNKARVPARHSKYSYLFMSLKGW